MRSAPLRASALALSFLFACGGSSLTTPEDLPITTYPADTEFRMTLVMDTCADPCATYEPAECSVSVEGMTIEVDVEVAYEHNDDGCALTNQCGGQVLAHCTVRALGAGTYTVQAGSFQRQITVR
jgi:hypothetical protein